jgi:hypothetical protein
LQNWNWNWYVPSALSKVQQCDCDIESLTVRKLDESGAEDAGLGFSQADLVNGLYSIERETNRFKACLEANVLVLEASEAWYNFIGQDPQGRIGEEAHTEFGAAIRSTQRQLYRLSFILRDIGTAMQQVSISVRVSYPVY